MKPGPRPKPASELKLRRSFRFLQITVDKINAAVIAKAAGNSTEAVEKAVEEWDIDEEVQTAINERLRRGR